LSIKRQMRYFLRFYKGNYQHNFRIGVALLS
jgi:hypothetical protein